MIQSLIQLLAFATLISNIILAVLIAIYLLAKADKNINAFCKKISKLINEREIKFAFLISLIATSGSLFLSEIANFSPCTLCWYQRIFIYPLVIVLGTAIIKKLKDVFNYVLPLAFVGFVIALYHYYFQISGNPLIPCSTVGYSVSCSERFFTYYGYITIPWMSLSAYALIIFLMLNLKSRVKKS